MKRSREKIEPFKGWAVYCFPANPGLRENSRIIRAYRSSRFISSTKYRDAKHSLVKKLAVAWSGYRFAPKTKTRVWITYSRAHYKDDPSGYVKAILDVVAEVIGCDDRYFEHAMNYKDAGGEGEGYFNLTVTQS